MRWIVGSIPHGGPFKLFIFPVSAPRLVNKGRCVCYPVCGMVLIGATAGSSGYINRSLLRVRVIMCRQRR